MLLFVYSQTLKVPKQLGLNQTFFLFNYHTFVVQWSAHPPSESPCSIEVVEDPGSIPGKSDV